MTWFYIDNSGLDPDSLHSMKTILNAKQVTKNVRNNYYAVSYFLDKVLESHLVLAADRFDISPNADSTPAAEKCE